jgi:hypothetical protein
MSSKITIDTPFFLPKIDNYTARRQANQRQQREVSRLTLQYAQEWLDLQAKLAQGDSQRTLPSTQRQARKQMATYVKEKIDLSNRKSSFFVPSFVWKFLAGKVIAYVVKLIIEHYWPDLVEEWGIDI